jgi:polysaccharide pyruvyl transferase CsaB
VGAANVGDELIFRSLTGKLHSRGVQVQVMSTDPQATRHLHGVEAVGWYDAAGVMRSIAQSDGIILGPGGLLQDETSIWNLPAHLHRIFIAKMVRTPVLGLGLGVGPLHSKLGRGLVRAALGSTPITVRDEESAALAAGIGLSNVTVTADVAYGLPIADVEPSDRIVASFRPFTGRGGIVPARRSDLRSLGSNAHVTAAARALDELSLRTSLQVHLLSFEPERDTRHHDLIAEAMTAPVTTAVTTVDSAFEDVARSRLVVAMRYHAVVSAIMAARPTVVVAYSPKVRAVARLMGSAGLVVPNEPDAFSAIADGVDLLDRGHGLTAVREERRMAERGNDEALERFLSSL